MLTTMTVAPGCELSDGSDVFWLSVFRVSPRICLSSCLSLQASEHLRFSPGEAQPERGAAGEAVREAGREGGEAWPSEPVTRNVSTEKEPQPATCLSLFKTASAPGSSRNAVVPSMASILLQTCDRGRRSHGSSSAGAEMARERGGVRARRGMSTAALQAPPPLCAVRVTPLSLSSLSSLSAPASGGELGVERLALGEVLIHVFRPHAGGGGARRRGSGAFLHTLRPQ